MCVFVNWQFGNEGQCIDLITSMPCFLLIDEYIFANCNSGLQFVRCNKNLVSQVEGYHW